MPEDTFTLRFPVGFNERITDFHGLLYNIFFVPHYSHVLCIGPDGTPVHFSIASGWMIRGVYEILYLIAIGTAQS